MQRKYGKSQTSIAPVQYALTTSDLHVLLALVRGGTLADAAERLQADASTVFRNIKRMEKALGQRLFERTRAGYIPGDIALEIARHAERIEAELEAARAAATGAGAPVSGRVRVATTDAVFRGLVMPTLPALLARHPQLVLEVRAGNELVSLTRRDADLAVRATPKPPDHLVGRHLGTVRFVVATQAIRGQRAPRKDPDLAGMPWLVLDDALPEHPSVRWRKRHMPKVRPSYSLDGVTAVADGIAAGLGIGIVPSFLLQTDPRLASLTGPLDDCESQLWLLAHPESRDLRRIAAVYAALAEGIKI